MNVLKKVILLLVIGICISCKNDDDATTNVQSIIGDWESISYVIAGEELVDPNTNCFDKYFITEENARFLEFRLLLDECIPLSDGSDSVYPTLPYSFDGTTFVFDTDSFEIIEITENTIKWSDTFENGGLTLTAVETLRRIQ